MYLHVSGGRHKELAFAFRNGSPYQLDRGKIKLLYINPCATTTAAHTTRLSHTAYYVRYSR